MGMSGVLTLTAGTSVLSQSDLGRFSTRDPIGIASGSNRISLYESGDARGSYLGSITSELELEGTDPKAAGD
jgi:hypothetical protein